MNTVVICVSLHCDEQCHKHLFSCYVDSKTAKVMKNNCVQTTSAQGLHFSCYLVFCSIRHLQQYSCVVSLSCHIMYIIYKVHTILFQFQFQISCRVVKCGLDILEVFKNSYDLPQPVIIHTYPVIWIFIIFYVMLNRLICE
jgi:hypothetical protein